ncbi:flagellar biosynthesis anti-sigma factor FlgM [bacterium]|nr:flagellar biosynthesis anti-sigma factor FlgM [bacterium]
MRISEIIASLVPKIRSIGPSKGTPELDQNGKIQARSDDVRLSDESQLLSRLTSELKSLPEIDEAKVAELRARIEAGEYNPSSHDIASKILGTDSD